MREREENQSVTFPSGPRCLAEYQVDIVRLPQFFWSQEVSNRGHAASLSSLIIIWDTKVYWSWEVVASQWSLQYKHNHNHTSYKQKQTVQDNIMLEELEEEEVMNITLVSEEENVEQLLEAFLPDR